jgi:hypothetical protein
MLKTNNLSFKLLILNVPYHLIYMQKKFLLMFLTFFCCQTFAQNTISKKVAKNGWLLLFDGKSLDNFRTYKGAKLNWEAINGELHNKNLDASEAARGDLITKKKYKDFVFSCEWRISEGGNSGIIYRASEEYRQPYLTGPEYQVADNEGYKGKMTDLQKVGANYDMEANLTVAARPVGQWNHTIILVNGNHVEHWLNHKKVLEYEINSDKWLAQKEKSKWKNAIKYGQEIEGHISLQDHGHEVWFKNLKIKEL